MVFEIVRAQSYQNKIEQLQGAQIIHKLKFHICRNVVSVDVAVGHVLGQAHCCPLRTPSRQIPYTGKKSIPFNNHLPVLKVVDEDRNDGGPHPIPYEGLYSQGRILSVFKALAGNLG